MRTPPSEFCKADPSTTARASTHTSPHPPTHNERLTSLRHSKTRASLEATEAATCTPDPELARALAELGLEATAAHVLPQGYVVDFALTAHKIAVVVDGADHFVGSSDVLRGEVSRAARHIHAIRVLITPDLHALTASSSVLRWLSSTASCAPRLDARRSPYFEWQPLRLLPEPRRAYVHEILAANWPEEAVAEEAAGAEGGAAPEEGAAAEAAPDA